MQPKLIVLCDDVGCGRETKTQTNIYLLAQHIGIDMKRENRCLDQWERRARYFDGPSLGLGLISSGSKGDDIASRCIEVYRYIVGYYTPEHEIWMFGLGLGAYVVRHVANMIGRCGIVRTTGEDDIWTSLTLIDHASFMYKYYYGVPSPSLTELETFKRERSWGVDKPIKFMGLFDTIRPDGFLRVLLLDQTQWPELGDGNTTNAVQNIYHAVSIHERSSFFRLCQIQEDSTYQTDYDTDVYEMWFPGTHHDLGRQKFPLGLDIDAKKWPFWLLSSAIDPNLVLTDLVLKWMLENIQREDSSEALIPDIGTRIEALKRELTRYNQSPDSESIYSWVVKQTPLGALLSHYVWLTGELRQGQTLLGAFLLFCYVWLLSELRWRRHYSLGVPFFPYFWLTGWLPRDRKILNLKARTYDYKRPLDQSGATIDCLARINKQRYPSDTYLEFQKARLSAGEIDQTTYECLVGNEHIGQRAKVTSWWDLDNGQHVVLDLGWRGPDFSNYHQRDWKEVLTITDASHGGGHYMARTIPNFLAEFYGEMGLSLLEWVTELCTARTRVASKMASQATPQTSPDRNSSPTFDRVHLHLVDRSIMACFGDELLRWDIPEGFERKQAVSALLWVVAAFQPPEVESRGLFKVGCRISDGGVLSPYCEPFKPERAESSCWTQLFDYACVVETPRDVSFDTKTRPEGLEVDFKELMAITNASQAWLTDYGAILLGHDTALIQLRPVEDRRWHAVRTPGKLITPFDIMQIIQSSVPSGPAGLGAESEDVGRSILSVVSSSAGILSQPQLRESNGAIKKSMDRGKHAQVLKSEPFTYPEGRVFVGWCSEPRVTIGTERPSNPFLESFDHDSGVPEVTNDIVALSSVSSVTTVSLGVSLGFMSKLATVNIAHASGSQESVQPATYRHENQLPFDTLRTAKLTPCILWDDSVKRAWLLPGVSALCFISLCIFARLELNFDSDVTFAIPSNDAGQSASNCLKANASLTMVKDDGTNGPTFGWLVKQVWDGMMAANDVCYANTNRRKHVREGVVFGYDIYDLFGSGHVVLRCLDENRAGASLHSWAPLARLERVQVIFCKKVGSVIECAAQTCAGTPCGQYCLNFDGTSGVLSCLLPDLERFCGQDWDKYSQSRRLLIKNGFEWIPRLPRRGGLFAHLGTRLNANGVCECCAELDRLQRLDQVGNASLWQRIKKAFRERPYNFADNWSSLQYAVRFGLCHLYS